MIIDEEHVIKTLVIEVEREMEISNNTAAARKRICDRLKQHPLVDDAYDAVWPFGADPDIIEIKVKIDGGLYKKYILRVTKKAA